MSNEIKYERKTVRTVRGSDGLVISKMRKEGWEFVDQRTVGLKTTLNFRRRRNPIAWIRVAASATAAVLLATIIAVGAAREGNDGESGRFSPPLSAAAPSPVQVKGATYASVSELMNAAIKGGYLCPSRAITRSAGLNGRQHGSCSEHDTFSLTYDTRHSEGAVRKAAVELIEELRDDPYMQGATFLVGANWGIQCSRAEAMKLQKSMGGVIATVPGEDAR